MLLRKGKEEGEAKRLMKELFKSYTEEMLELDAHFNAVHEVKIMERAVFESTRKDEH